MKFSRGEKVFDGFLMTAFLLVAFIFLFPFWHVLVLSFNEGQDALRGGIYFWPRQLTLGNYRLLFNNDEIVTAYKITIFRTVIGAVSQTFITAMVAFALSRRELPGRGILITILFITMLFSGGLIPFYLLLRDLHLINSFWVYVIPGLFSVWTMIIMKTVFMEFPPSLVESAMIDGAGYFRVFIQILLPLSMPVMATMFLFSAVGNWNDWFAGAFFVTNSRLQPLQTYLQRLLNMSMNAGVGQNASVKNIAAADIVKITPKSLRMATIMVVVIPITLVYPFLQRYFVKGVMIGSMKE
jgi:putative aldouronate transport system permease protein